MSDANQKNPTPSDGEAALSPPVAANDRVKAGIDAVRNRWMLAVGVVTWLTTIIAPALSFDVKLALNSASGPQFKAFFLVLTAALFLLAWRSLARLPLWALGGFAALSLLSFLAYSLAKDSWTCPYYPNIFNERFVMGTELLDQARSFLRGNPLADASCQALMENWGGDARKIWTWSSVVQRFLALFGLYAFAWLTLALLVLGAARYSLLRWRR